MSRSILARGAWASLLGLILTAAPAPAQTNTYTWTGGDIDSLWFSSLNWSLVGPGSRPPADNITTTFVVLAGNTKTTNTLDYSFGTNRLTFAAGAGAFTVNDAAPPDGPSTLTIGTGGIIVASGNTNNQTFNAGLAQGAAGTWTNNGTGTFTVNGTIDNGGFLLTVGGAGNSIYTGVISGAGGLTKTGSSTLTLGGVNTYSGNVTVSAGTLSVSADRNFGTVPGAATPGKIVLNGGTIAVTSGFTLSGNRGISLGPTSGTGNGTINVASGQTLTYSGAIANNGGSGVLVKTGAGTLLLNGNSSFTGGVVINDGVLQVPSVSSNTAGASERLGAVPASPTANAVTISNGAVLRNTNTGTVGSSFVTANRGITIGAGGGVFDLPDTASGTFLIYGGIVDQGSNPLTKTGAAVLALSGTTTGTGALNINEGMVRLRAASNRISDTSAVTIAIGAALDMATFSDTIGSLAGAGNVTFGAGIGTLTSGGTNASTTFSGVISGSGSITKVGTGTLTLTGTNTYTGATTINSGTLAVGTGGSLASASAVAVNNTGTLAGTGAVNGSVTVASGGTLAPGASGAGTLAIGGNTILNTGSTLTIGAAADGTNSGVNILGSSTTFDFKSGSILDLALLSGFSNASAAGYTLVTMPAGSGDKVLVDGIPTNPGDVLGTFIQGTGASGSVTIMPSGFALANGDTFILSRTGDAVLLSFQPVPEPATVLGLTAGVLGFGQLARRRLRRA